MPVFDPQKMTDLVAEESRVASELQAISRLTLNEQHDGHPRRILSPTKRPMRATWSVSKNTDS